MIGIGNRSGCAAVSVTIGMLVALYALVAVGDARAGAPPGPPGCEGLLATSHENTTPTGVPTGPAVVSSTIEVSGAGEYLTDVDMFMDLPHTFAADLDITLQSPAGTVATITTDNGAGNDNVFAGTTFDDQADPDGQVPYSTNPGMTSDNPYANNQPVAALTPEQALASFAGENPNGTWTLTISDDLAGDGGTLESWRLDIATGACAPAPVPTGPTEPQQPTEPATPVTNPPAAPAQPAKPDTAPDPVSDASEAGSLGVGIARLSKFDSASARCRVTTGSVGSCKITLRADGRVIARGKRAGNGERVRVPLKLTAAGRRMLAERLGGARANVTATAEAGSATARTRAILRTERVVTPAGSWVPNEAVLTPAGERFVRNLRGRLVAVQSYNCDGHTAALEGRRADSRHARALSLRRAQVMCGALPQRGIEGKSGLVGHGGTEPIASNRTDAGRAHNRRVEISVNH
jgi:subtilisin-like proprotein convertase family protein/outer membrane protein OmpA-like peptidoglycan-associated protein